MKPTLREYQIPVYDAVIDHFKSEKGHEPGIINCSVGAGKTAIAAFISQNTVLKGGKVLILARQSDLILQDGRFVERLGIKCSYYSAGLGAKRLTHNVVAATEGTIARALTGDFAKWSPDLIIVDEAHQVPIENPDTMMMRVLLHFMGKNKKCRVLGMTGSPFRNNEPIVGDFWKKCLAEISTEHLVHEGWLVHPIYGFPDQEEDSFKFDEDAAEWSEEQFDLFRAGDPTKSQRIVADVVSRTTDRLSILWCCQSKKHMREVASALPPDSWVLVDDDADNREGILERVRNGEIRHTVQLSILSTGVDISRWDVIVFLRPIGSLTLLIQSMGRTFRLHVDPSIDMDALTAEGRKEVIAASDKPNALILDYATVFERLGPLFESQFLADAEYERAKREGSTILCPSCSTENSDKARRCKGVDHKGERCDHFWIKQDCKHCGAHNDVTAQECRICKEQLRDPNEKLLGKSYTDDELVPVERMDIEPTKNGGLMFRYILQGDKPEHGWPVEFFNPEGSETARRVFYNQILKVHVPSPSYRNRLYKMKTSGIIGLKGAIQTPSHIAYRINQKGKHVVGRKKFKNYIQGMGTDTNGN